MIGKQPAGWDQAPPWPSATASMTAPPIGGRALPMRLDGDAEFLHRIERLPRDVGWLLVSVGVLGVVLPGVVGFPLLLAGAAVVTPGGPKRIARWIGRKPPRLVRVSVTQIERFLDDLDRRYPPIPKRGRWRD